MPTFQTTAGPGAGPAWQPLGTPDYGAIGFTTVVDVGAALLVLHVVSNAAWPPYAAAIPQIIVFSSLAAIVATFGVSVRYGMWGADGQEVGCTAVACLVWLGLGALFSTAFLRVYRYHDVLVKHSGLMWPAVCQLVGLLIPFTLAPAFLASPDLATFDSNSLECQSASRVPELFSFGAMGILALTSLMLAFRLRVARVQAPCEFESAVITSLTLLAAAIALPLVHFKADQDRAGRRVAMLVLTALTSVGVVGSPVFHPLKSFIVNEEKLETSGDYSLGEWRSKKKTKYMQLQSSKFKEAASSERDIDGFPAIAEFFRVVMAREEVESYPLLQASTMRILDTYFRKGAPTADAVPLSDMCRSKTLTFRASSAYIFDRARGEMLEKMGVGKVLLPEDEALSISRSHSTATTRASSQCATSSPGQTDAADGSPASRAAALAKKLPSPPKTASPSYSSRPPPPSRASSTASSLNYSTDSEPSQSPLGLSPLHQPPSSSPLKPDSSRRSAEICATDDAPDPPMSPPLNYRGDRAVDRDRNKKKKQEKTENNSGSRPKNPIFSLFSRLGSGAASRSRVQDGSSNESSPSVVHMGDDEDDDVEEGFDAADVYDGPMEKGQAAKTLGRTGGDTGVRTVAKVVDVHAAFGLAKKDDEDDDEIQQYRSTGFFGAIKNKKKKDHRAASSSASSGIGGYGSVLSSCSTSPDSGNDLAEAARAIPKPLFGDSSRAVGRQNHRSSLKSTTSTGAAAGASSAFASNITTTTTTTNAAVLRGHSLDLADAYGLDLAEEGGHAADAEPTPPPKISTVNPLFGDSGGGGRVKAMARAFDAEAQAQAVSGGRVAVDNNKIGLPGRAAPRKKRGGRRGESGGGASVGRLGSSGSALQVDVFTITEAGEGEEEEDDDEDGGGDGNDQKV